MPRAPPVTTAVRPARSGKFMMLRRRDGRGGRSVVLRPPRAGSAGRAVSGFAALAVDVVLRDDGEARLALLLGLLTVESRDRMLDAVLADLGRLLGARPEQRRVWKAGVREC